MKTSGLSFSESIDDERLTPDEFQWVEVHEWIITSKEHWNKILGVKVLNSYQFVKLTLR